MLYDDSLEKYIRKHMARFVFSKRTHLFHFVYIFVWTAVKADSTHADGSYLIPCAGR